MRKIVFIAGFILISAVLFWSFQKIALDISGRKITIQLFDEDKNPYQFSEKIRKLQIKLNRALAFNLKEYEPVQETGYWNKETEKALEDFRAMYYKKYNLQRYYSFSAGDGINPSDWDDIVGREAPSPAGFLVRNEEKQQMKLGDPAKYYGNSALNEAGRIESGIENSVNPVSGEVNRSVPVYASPEGTGHAAPIRLSLQYGSQGAQEEPAGKGWYLTENYALWYSCEKNEVVIQEGNGVSQEYSFSNGVFVLKGLDKTAGYFKKIALEGNFGEINSRIKVLTQKGEELDFESPMNSGGDTVETVREWSVKSAIVYGYKISLPLSKNTNNTNISTVNSGSDNNNLTGKWNGYPGVKIENNEMTVSGGTMGGNTGGSPQNVRGELLGWIDRVLTDSSRYGFSVSFWADQTAGTNGHVFNFSQKGTTDFGKMVLGYKLVRNKNRYGARKDYEYDSDGKLTYISAFAPDGKQFDSVSFTYMPESAALSKIAYPYGSAEFLYATNQDRILTNLSVVYDGKKIDYDYTYTNFDLGMDTNRYQETLTNLQNALKQIHDGITNINDSLDKMHYPPQIQDLYYTNLNPQDLISFYSFYLSEIKSQLTNQYAQIQKQLGDLTNGKMNLRLEELSGEICSIPGWSSTNCFNYSNYTEKFFNLTNAEYGVRAASAETPYGTARFEYDPNQTRYYDPLSNQFVFGIDNNPSNKINERRIKSITYPAGGTVRFAFNTNGNIVCLTNELNQVYTYTYDELGNVLTKNLPDGKTWAYEYGNDMARTLGQPTKINQPDGSDYEMKYNSWGEMVLQNLNGSTISRTQFEPETPVNQGYIRTSYDLYNSPTVYTYDTGHRLLSLTQPDGSSITFQNDKFGRVINRIQDGVNFFTVYDNRGNVASTGIKGVSSSYSVFDALGRKIQDTDAAGNKVFYIYNLQSRMIKTDLHGGEAIEFAYDANGNKVLEDYGAWTNGYYYDGNGRLSNRTLVDRYAVYFYTYSYDAAGNMTRQTADGRGFGPDICAALRVKQPVIINDYIYNSLGMPVVSSNLVNGAVSCYGYDLIGRLSVETNLENGVTIVKLHSYDELGRVTGLRVQRKDETGSRAYQTILSNIYLADRSVKKIDANSNISVSYNDFRNNPTNLTYTVFDPLTGQNRVLNHSYFYDGFGNKTREIYPDGTVSLWEFEAGNRQKKESGRYREGETVNWKTYVNDAMGRPVTITDRRGKIWSRTYEYHGKIAKETDPEGRTSSYRYDILGNRIYFQADNRVIETEYSFFRKPVQVKYADNTSDSYSYDVLGNLSWKQNGTTLPETAAYDADNRRIASYIPLSGTNGILTTDAYDPEGNSLASLETAGNKELRTAAVYDVLNRKLIETLPDGEAVTNSYQRKNGLVIQTVSRGQKQTDIYYDQLNREIKRVIKDSTLAASSEYSFFSGTGIITGQALNLAGLPVMMFENGRLRELSYNSEGLSTNEINGYGTAEAEAKTTTYDAEANPVSTRDAAGNVYQNIYDNSGKLVRTINPDMGETFYSYNAAGELVSKTMPDGSINRMNYDARGRINTETNPFGGVTRYTYDARGNPLTVTAPDGDVTERQYYPSGKTAQIKSPDGRGGQFITSFYYDERGRTNRIVRPDNSVETTGYDDMGRVTTHTLQPGIGTMEPTPGPSQGGEDGGRTTSYIYNAEGLLACIVYPGGRSESNVYRVSGLIDKKIILTNNTPAQKTEYEYIQPGFIERNTDYRGVQTTVYSDGLGRTTNRVTLYADGMSRSDITEYSIRKGQRTVTSYSLASGKDEPLNWNRSIQDFRGQTVESGQLNGKDEIKVYTAVYGKTGMPVRECRLVSAEKWGETVCDYDNRGAQVRKTDPSGLITLYTYDNMGRVINENAGNRQTATVYALSGNTALKNKSGLSIISYQYDWRGNAVWISNNINGTVNMAGYDTFGQKTWESTVWRGTSIGKRYSYDAAGNMTQSVNETGGVTEYVYDALGRATHTLQLPTPGPSQGGVNGGGGLKTVFVYDTKGDLVLKVLDGGIGAVYTNRFEYDSRGNMTNTIYPDGSHESFTYDGAGNKTAQTDRFGYRAETVYDGYGREKTITIQTPGGTLTTENYYDEAGFLAQTIRKDGVNPPRKNKRECDNAGRITKESVLTGNEFADRTYSYDVFGSRTAESDFEGNITRTDYDALGRASRKTSAAGRVTIFSYSPDGLALRQVQGPTIISLSAQTPTHPVSGMVTTTRIIDGFGRVVEEIDGRGYSNTTAYIVSTNGMTMVTTDRRGFATTRNYDVYGRLTETKDCYNNSLKNEYDAFGNTVVITDKNNNKLTRTFDWQGRVLSTTDALGNKATTRTLRLQPTPVPPYGGVNGECAETIDAEGNVTRTYKYGDLTLAVEDAMGGKTGYKYNAYGELIETVDANGNLTRLERDSRGNIKTRTTTLGFKTQYEYNGNNMAVSEVNGEEWITTVYDADGNPVQKRYKDWNEKNFTYDNLGRLTDARDKFSHYSYSYDPDGNLILKTDVLNNTALAYEYDENGNRVSMVTGPSIQFSAEAENHSGTEVKIVNYQYDGLGQILNETVRTGPSIQFSAEAENHSGTGYITNLIINYAYEAMGQVTNKTFSTGLKTTYEYDGIYRLTKIQNYTNMNTLLTTMDYAYDRVGNRTKETSSATLGDRISAFQYDKNYRLVSAAYGDDSSEAFTYDAVGNRLTKALTPNPSQGGVNGTVRYIYDNDNRLIGEQDEKGIMTRYAYDTAGRIVSKVKGSETERFKYDSRDLMTEYSVTKAPSVPSGATSYTVTKYQYNVENLRISKTGTINTIEIKKTGNVYYEVPLSADTVRYTYDGQNLLTENSSVGTSEISSFYLNNIDVNSYEAEIQPLRLSVFIKDAVGSVRGEVYDKIITVNSVALTHKAYDYTAFGEILPSDGETDEKGQNIKSRVGYTGHYGDDESGLYYARARYYDPSAGRFLTRDPNTSDVSPAGLDRYVYGINNPVRYTDPSGANIFDDIGNFFSGIIDAIGSGLSSIGNAIGSAVSSAASAAQNALQSVISGIGNTVSNVIKTLSTVYQSVFVDNVIKQPSIRPIKTVNINGNDYGFYPDDDDKFAFGVRGGKLYGLRGGINASDYSTFWSVGDEITDPNTLSRYGLGGGGTGSDNQLNQILQSTIDTSMTSGGGSGGAGNQIVQPVLNTRQLQASLRQAERAMIEANNVTASLANKLVLKDDDAIQPNSNILGENSENSLDDLRYDNIYAESDIEGMLTASEKGGFINDILKQFESKNQDIIGRSVKKALIDNLKYDPDYVNPDNTKGVWRTSLYGKEILLGVANIDRDYVADRCENIEDSKINVIDSISRLDIKTAYGFLQFIYTQMPLLKSKNDDFEIKITSIYRSNANWHKDGLAFDINYKVHTPVLSPVNGKVSYSQYDPYGGGNIVSIKGDDGLTYRFMHNESLLVTDDADINQYVQAGQIISYSGDTGGYPPHLHFDVRVTR